MRRDRQIQVAAAINPAQARLKSADPYQVDRHSRLAAERDALFGEQRHKTVWLDCLGLLGIAGLTCAALGSFLDIGLLVTWVAAVVSQALAGFWAEFYEMPEFHRKLASWWRSVGLTLALGLLPLLAFNHIDNSGVAWYLVFMVGVGLAGDALYLPQTYTTSITIANVSYTLPYLIVFGFASQWIPAAATLGVLVYISAGASGVVFLVKDLIDRRVDATISAEVSDRLAHSDPLTGLANRAGATVAINRLLTSPDVGTIHCLFLDLDDFKLINDAYGYGAGDRALKDMANNLERIAPDGWTACRFGGDEFVLLGSDGDAAQVGVDVMDLRVAPLTEPSGRSITSLKLSVGMVSIPREEASGEHLFLHAGSALQTAKQAGKHQLVVSTSELQTKLANERALTSDLNRAMEADEIIPFAMAIVDVGSGIPVGVEVLARWSRNGEIIPPSEFIPLVEQAGYSHRLDRLMINHAVSALDMMAERGMHNLTVSVNVAASHLEVDTFSDYVAMAIGRSETNPNRLVLEVTESVQLAESKLVQATARRLRSAGVGLAIDDFGTGYSSITQLLSLPFTQLKLDRSLVTRISDPAAFDMVKALAKFAQSYGLKVVAEGIESHADLGGVRKAGIFLGQGYFYSKPKPLGQALYDIARLLPQSERVTGP